MAEEEVFGTEGALKAWLESKGVGERKAAEAAPVLFDKGFDNPDTLNGISSTQLERNGLTTPLAQLLSNKLAKPQQQDGKLTCCRLFSCSLCCSNIDIRLIFILLLSLQMLNDDCFR